jgi:integrase
VGTPLDAHNVRRSFRAITKAAGLGQEWTPRELRHTFVSLLSANDVNLEDIARLVGHSGTSVTERVYRHEIRPSLTPGCRNHGPSLPVTPGLRLTGRFIETTNTMKSRRLAQYRSSSAQDSLMVWSQAGFRNET